MKETVYIETSLVSYLVAKPSRDLITASRQQITAKWWENKRHEFELVASQIVVDEVSSGDAIRAAERLKLLSGIKLLDVSDKAIELASHLIEKHALPTKAAQDALHIAIAVVHGVNYLITWNCKHIANAQMRVAINRTCRLAGYEPPILCTPEELAEESF